MAAIEERASGIGEQASTSDESSATNSWDRNAGQMRKRERRRMKSMTIPGAAEASSSARCR